VSSHVCLPHIDGATSNASATVPHALVKRRSPGGGIVGSFRETLKGATLSVHALLLLCKCGVAPHHILASSFADQISSADASQAAFHETKVRALLHQKIRLARSSWNEQKNGPGPSARVSNTKIIAGVPFPIMRLHENIFALCHSLLPQCRRR